MSSPLQAITVPPASNHPAKGLIILLHGWGANAQDVLGLATLMQLPDYQLVFPDAPFDHPYNIPYGKMWYGFPQNFNFATTPAFRDRPDLTTSRQKLTDFIKTQAEQVNLPLSQVVLGGFSQGGAMTLDVGVDLPLAGLMVLSGYLHAPLQPQVAQLPPVLMVHGTQDTVVPVAAARQARSQLEALGASVEYHEFVMGHEIQPVVLEQLRQFVNKVLD